MKVDINRLYSGTVSPTTVKIYKKNWDSYKEFAGSEDEAMLPSSFSRYREYLINETEYSRATINLRITTVHSIMSYLYATGVIELETLNAFKRTRILRKFMLRDRGNLVQRTRIEPEEMRRICDAARIDIDSPREMFNRALVLVLATSGLRVTEVANIKANNVVMQDGYPMIIKIEGKGGKEREAPLSQEAYDAVQDWLKLRPVHSKYVFNGFNIDSDGILLWADKPANRSYLLKQVKLMAKRAGVKNVKTHDFRRFVGTQLARKDLRLAQKVLGHANIQTTARHYILDRVPGGVTSDLF